MEAGVVGKTGGVGGRRRSQVSRRQSWREVWRSSRLRDTPEMESVELKMSYEARKIIKL